MNRTYKSATQQKLNNSNIAGLIKSLQKNKIIASQEKRKAGENIEEEFFVACNSTAIRLPLRRTLQRFNRYSAFDTVVL